MISYRRRGGALLLSIATGSLLIGGVAIAAPPTVGSSSWQAFLGAETREPPSSPSTSTSRSPWRTAAPVAAALPTAAPVAATTAPALPTPEPTPAPTTTPEAVPVRAIVQAPKSAEARSEPDSESEGKVSGAAAEVIRETNEERRDAGCGDLAPDSRLAGAAQSHASDMADNDYFSHDSEDGTRFDERIRAEGHPRPGGENIAMGQTSAKQVVQEWMDSPGHRRNILNCAFRTIGVGHDDNYWVQDFGR